MLVISDNGKVIGIEDRWSLDDIANSLECYTNGVRPSDEFLIEIVKYIDDKYDCNNGISNEVIQAAYKRITI